jgi:hypothetical protein
MTFVITDASKLLQIIDEQNFTTLGDQIKSSPCLRCNKHASYLCACVFTLCNLIFLPDGGQVLTSHILISG